MSSTINDFYRDFMKELLIKTDQKTSAHSEMVFTEVFIDYLEELGETDGVQICNHLNPHYQTKLSGFSFNEENTRIDLYVSLFNKTIELQEASEDEFISVINGVQNFYLESKSNLINFLQQSTEEYEASLAIKCDHGSFKTIGLHVLSNLKIDEKLHEVPLNDKKFELNVWDIERVFEIVSAEENHETIKVDFDEPLPCLEIDNEVYKSYLAIFPANTLAEIYEKYKLRLLERNVRAFLQVKGKVNIGIKNTLSSEPELFFAYNNGISAIASNVDVQEINGSSFIKSIDGLQIVNGGQTTASIHNAIFHYKFDVSQVNVQMKLTKIKISDFEEDIYSNISRFANTQNAIQIADFSANSPFHKKIEEYSRSVEAYDSELDFRYKWFYERIRGQYQEYLKRNDRHSHDYFPKEKLFTKLELAKYQMAWEQRPEILSKGQMYCFQTFMEEYVQPSSKAKQKVSIIPDEDYYRNLIAKGILFRDCYRLIKALKYPSYVNNIVAYTVSMISYLTHKKLNLADIWSNQRIDQNTTELIEKISAYVRESIITNAGSENISSYCKKVKCWEAMVNDSASWPLDDVVSRQNIKVLSLNGSIDELMPKSISDGLKLVESTDPEMWFSLSFWGKETNVLTPWERQFCFSIGKTLSRKYGLSQKQVENCIRILKKAETRGYKYKKSS